MDHSEAFIFLFFDALMANLVFPLQSHLVLPVMFIFGGYPKFQMLLTMVAGSMLATWLNMGFGRILVFLKRGDSGVKKDDAAESKLQQLKSLVQRYGCYGLALCIWMPFFGAVYTIVLGLYRIHWKRITVFAFLGHIGGFALYAL